MLKDLYEIIDGLDRKPDDWGKPHFTQDRYYKPFSLSADNFHEYDFGSGDRVISAVDGGNNKIYGSPTDSIHLIKIYYNLFRGKKRKMNVDPFTSFLICRNQDDSIEVELKPLNDTIPIDKKRYSLKKDEMENGNQGNAAQTIRKYLEWKTLKYVCEEHLDEGDILLRDGVLQTSVEDERRYAEEVYDSVKDNGINLVGLAKTSSLLTDKGYPLIASVHELSEETEFDLWYYHPIAENDHPDHKGEMYVVKYHPSSEYAFRTEFFRGVESPVEDILGHLASQAKDPIFLGYPYGLVDADKKARVTDEEVKYLKNMGYNKMDSSVRYRVNCSNAHDKLSNI